MVYLRFLAALGMTIRGGGNDRQGGRVTSRRGSVTGRRGRAKRATGGGGNDRQERESGKGDRRKGRQAKREEVARGR